MIPSKMTTNSKRDKSRYPCTVEGCLRSYKTKGDLKIHLASHSGIPADSKYYCVIGQVFYPMLFKLKVVEVSSNLLLLTSAFRSLY